MKKKIPIILTEKGTVTWNLKNAWGIIILVHFTKKIIIIHVSKTEFILGFDARHISISKGIKRKKLITMLCPASAVCISTFSCLMLISMLTFYGNLLAFELTMYNGMLVGFMQSK